MRVQVHVGARAAELHQQQRAEGAGVQVGGDGAGGIVHLHGVQACRQSDVAAGDGVGAGRHGIAWVGAGACRRPGNHRVRCRTAGQTAKDTEL